MGTLLWLNRETLKKAPTPLAYSLADLLGVLPMGIFLQDNGKSLATVKMKVLNAD